MSEKTKNLSKKIKIIIGVLIIIVVGIIISLLLINKVNKVNGKVIFVNSYDNYAWTPVSDGYKIYDNGIIEEYDEYNNDEELKRAKISNEELAKLKELADSVESKYTKNLNPQSILHPNSFAGAMKVMLNDSGVTEKKIYNSKKSKWITLYEYGDIMGYNDTKETKEIIELTEQLYEKYLADNK